MRDTDHTIYLRRSDEGFAVAVEPEVPGFDFTHNGLSYIAARTFAKGVKLHRGFPVVDETGEAQP